ncbi:synphilin-1 [Carcharodon carcharias]|uniref:synphilin-1 n=1 Tax=Carcharodon carcharias TaxID=13397 RepID=UPI001B7EAE96|nr:synphilin-1 [Carcharodon carcharias]XP_041042804.1 synphilin-1 [Carcharodon carcharias]XP_041042805.1 synphilin-1 [Carcharodon carcharias]XP_041042807.1 synphilin-1 [Carcharodon carcharias]
MDTPEYLDLDAIDFSDDVTFGSSSAKALPELYKRSDMQNEGRIVSSSNWPSGGTSSVSSGIKAKGITDVYSKFRPVKRVSPLKHQPENSENDRDTEQHELKDDYKKQDDAENPSERTTLCHNNGQCFKIKDTGTSILLGELEHYDLDMDEILDVPYIKLNHFPSQRCSPFTKVASENRPGVEMRDDGTRICSAVKHENSPANLTQFCILSPVNSLELRKAKAVVTNHHRHVTGSLESSQSSDGCDAVHNAEAEGKDLTSRTSSLFVNSHGHNVGGTVPNSRPRTLSLQTPMESKLEEGNSNKNGISMGRPGETSEEAKNIKSILNIVREGQISLLPHLTVDNLEKIHDEKGNNLLHIAASQGHLECLQHLTTLMAEECLTERNNEKLTPSSLAVKEGQLECLRWLMSETEAIAELSPSDGYPALIHYAACYGQEKVLLWLLQYMQEQGISLDEVDQYGNTAAHVATQHGHLSCLQTLVEYGANVTIQNQDGEKPSQSAERHGHTTCSRYLVVVETCMSLASQVVKLTKQLKEQTAEQVNLQNQLQHFLQDQMTEGSEPQSSSSFIPSENGKKKTQTSCEQKMTGISANGSATTCNTETKPKTTKKGLLKQKGEEADKILRQLLGEEISGNVCTQEKLSLEFQDGQEASVVTGSAKKVLRDKRELKLTRLRYSQRSSSESDTDSYISEDQKNSPIKRADKPRPEPIVEKEEYTAKVHFMIKKHASAVGRMFPFSLKASGTSEERSHSPTAESNDKVPDCQHQIKSPVRTQSIEEPFLPCADNTTTQKTTNSPKSALKSPSSKSRTSQNLKLRVTFEEPVVEIEQTICELDNRKGTESEGTLPKSPASLEMGEPLNRYVGQFRSPVESINSNQNNNNSQAIHLTMTSTPNLPLNSTGRKPGGSKASFVTPTKVNTKTMNVVKSTKQ